MQELLRREAGRPPPTSWRTAIATIISLMGGIVMVAGFTWWFVSVSPAVIGLSDSLTKLRTDLDRRLTRIDDPEIGRLPRAEKRLEDLERWAPKVTRH